MRVFPDSLEEIRYDDRHIVRPVRKNGTIRWKSKEVFITEVLRRERIGLLPTPAGALGVYFGQLHLGIIDAGTTTFNPNRECFAGQPQGSEELAVSSYAVYSDK
jgi:hypothetical protein